MDSSSEPEAKRARLSDANTDAAAESAPAQPNLASDGENFATTDKNDAFLAPVINELSSANSIVSSEPSFSQQKASSDGPEEGGENISSLLNAPQSTGNQEQTKSSLGLAVGVSADKIVTNAYVPQPQSQIEAVDSGAPVGNTSNSIGATNVGSATSVLQSGSPSQTTTTTNAAANSEAASPEKPRTRRLVLMTEKTYTFMEFLLGLQEDPANEVQEVLLDDSENATAEGFDYVHLCVVLNDTCEELLERITKYVLADQGPLSQAKNIGLHFDFLRCKHWTEVSEQLRTAYVQTVDAAANKWDSKVTHCSFISKHSPVTDIFLDDEDIPPMTKDVNAELARWHNLRVLDYSRNSIRLVSGIKFPDTLRTLNLGGGYSLESLNGLKFPPQLEELVLSLNMILSTDYVVYPSTLKSLNLLENRIYFLDSVEFPALLEYLDVSQNRIDTLKNVVFPRKLSYLLILMNPIECIKGVRFPDTVDYLDASCLPNESMTGIKFPDHAKSLNLQSSMTNTRGLKLPAYVETLNMASNGVNSINPLKLPNSIQCLYLSDNNIKTLNKVAFPTSIRELYLGNNMITTLKNVQFPPTLEVLDMAMDPENDENEKFVTSLKDVYFPANLRVLRLGYHLIKTIEGVDFPYGLEELELQYNDLRVFRNVKFGPKLHTLDLSGNQDLVALDNVYFPESLRELRVPSLLLDNLPAVIVERANKQQLKINKSLPYTT